MQNSHSAGSGIKSQLSIFIKHLAITQYDVCIDMMQIHAYQIDLTLFCIIKQYNINVPVHDSEQTPGS